MLSRPTEILLVEDNPGDIRLTREVLKEGKVLNHLYVVGDGAVVQSTEEFWLTIVKLPPGN